MSSLVSFILTLFILIHTTDVFAAAAVARRQQMQRAQQEAMQQQAMEQAYAQQQQQVQAQQQQQAQMQQQQAMQQQQQVQMQQQQAQQQQMMVQVQQQQIQQQAMVQAVRIRRQQILDAQDHYTAAALTQQYQQAALQAAARQRITLEAAQMAQMQQMVQAQAAVDAVQVMQMKKQAEILQVGALVAKGRPFEPVKPEDVRDVADIAEVWQKLDKDSRAWALMIDNQAKVITVNEYSERFRKQGVKIQITPIEYVHMIDDMAMQNPTLLKAPFQDVLQISAIMEYDFDNGMDKDTLARKVLGEEMYLANKKRLGR